MTDKKITDEEIIKALEHCNADRNECDECVLKEECVNNPFDFPVAETALDLINRQKAEIEALKMEFSEMRYKANSYKAENERLNEIIKNCHQEILQKCDSCNNRIKAEAYKEFSERLIKNSRLIAYANGFDVKAVVDVEEIVKIRNEMVGEE